DTQRLALRILRSASPWQGQLYAGSFFPHLRSGQFGNFILQPADVLAVGMALGDGADAEVTHRFGVVRPMVPYDARHLDISGSIVAKKRATPPSSHTARS